MLLCSIAHSISCTVLFCGKMHSDWFNGIEVLQGRWQHGERVGYCYPSGLEKTLYKWDIYIRLVTKGLVKVYIHSCCCNAILSVPYTVDVKNVLFYTNECYIHCITSHYFMLQGVGIYNVGIHLQWLGFTTKYQKF